MEGAVQEQPGRWMVQGVGKREMGFYSERLDMVWEYSEKCCETVHPPDSKTLSAGSVPLRSPHRNIALEEQASLLLTVSSNGWTWQVLDINHRGSRAAAFFKHLC